MHLWELLQTSVEQLNHEQEEDILTLIEECFYISRTNFWLHRFDPINKSSSLKRFFRLFKRLQKNEPLAYILKKKVFFDIPFHINKNVLIPRPETELLVEAALQFVNNQPLEILEIGAGSGAIAIAIAKNSPAFIYATEICAKAMGVFKKNIRSQQLEKQIFPLLCNLFPDPHHRYDLIISNPPYISKKDFRKLPAGVAGFEPATALLAGPKGTEIIDKIAKQGYSRLKPGGTMFLEIGYDQKEMVSLIFQTYGYKNIEFILDFQQIDRIVKASR